MYNLYFYKLSIDKYLSYVYNLIKESNDLGEQAPKVLNKWKLLKYPYRNISMSI
nr:MAG TPA: hypothetical protein [Caudoviricetes sp.]